MAFGGVLLLIAAAWAVPTIGVVLLLTRAVRLLRDARTVRRQLVRCLDGEHRDTLDTTVDGLPALAWRCTACGERAMLGVAFVTGTNRRSRRTPQ